ncbi:peptidoglycan DD-metalloendopeptidase family protein [Orbaceae bacterium ESL0721]|nr:peptidoglycan DD-metalloendopeptidase family protein [Orbaceae bacterium ESL0721]
MKKIFTLSCLSILIVACTQNTPAEVSDISDLSSNDRSAEYIKPPANISTGGSISSSPQYNNYSQPIYAPSVTSSTVTTENQSTVDGSSPRIVYNRNYDSIPKGGYKGDFYTVKRGDTLYYIAWITGNDVRTLAVKNNLTEPYSINVGQVLDVTGGNSSITTPSTYRSKSVVTTTTSTPNQAVPIKQSTMAIPATSSTVSTPIRVDNSTSTRSNISWQWPAKGKIIEKFSNATKGIDIAGSLGNKVVAAANGRVVYSGNDLPGYGNLIIIKHNDDYLTAYAHNQSVLIKEQQTVKAGQQIATMGATGTSSIRLHFEIRYKGKSVDPQKYLP